MASFTHSLPRVLLGCCCSALCILPAAFAEEVPRFLQPRPSAVQSNERSDENATVDGRGPACFEWADCNGLGGDCCPAPDGMYLSCCNAPALPAPAAALAPTPTSEPTPATTLALTEASTPAPTSAPIEVSAPASAQAPLLGRALPMWPMCDRANVGFPNCGDAARCEGEYSVDGTTRTLRATSQSCAYVTFKTGLSLKDVVQLDADVYISKGTCSKQDNLAFWFFQTAEKGDAISESMTHWDGFSEVDFMETYIGPGGVNSVNSNFAATGLHRQWPNVSITGGVRQHVTMWQDTENSAGCPSDRDSASMFTRWVEYAAPLPVVSIYVAHCAPGAPCCQGDSCRELQGDPNTARACVTVKDAPMLLSLSNWGTGHWVTPGCEMGVSDVRVVTV